MLAEEMGFTSWAAIEFFCSGPNSFVIRLDSRIVGRCLFSLIFVVEANRRVLRDDP